MVAHELALAGVRPIVLDRLAEPSSELKANSVIGQVIGSLTCVGSTTSSGADPALHSP